MGKILIQCVFFGCLFKSYTIWHVHQNISKSKKKCYDFVLILILFWFYHSVILRETFCAPSLSSWLVFPSPISLCLWFSSFLSLLSPQFPHSYCIMGKFYCVVFISMHPTLHFSLAVQNFSFKTFVFPSFSELPQPPQRHWKLYMHLLLLFSS